MGVDYLPHVNVQRVHYTELEEKIEPTEVEHAEAIEKDNAGHVTFEIGKYIAKSSEYLESSEIFEMFFKNLFKRRSWTFTGKFKELHQQHKDVRLEQDADAQEVEYVYQADYNYKKGDYYMSKVKKIEEGDE